MGIVAGGAMSSSLLVHERESFRCDAHELGAGRGDPDSVHDCVGCALQSSELKPG